MLTAGELEQVETWASRIDVLEAKREDARAALNKAGMTAAGKRPTTHLLGSTLSSLSGQVRSLELRINDLLDRNATGAL